MGIKDRRTKVLLSLFLLSDEDLISVQLDERVQKAFDLSFNQKTRGTLAGMIKEGLIEKSSETEEIKTPETVVAENIAGMEKTPTPKKTSSANRYKLTEKGFKELILQFPVFRYLRENWDGKWRIISYEIPESKRKLRDKLRREMQGWGLGPWHRSFWITTHPIGETLKDLVSQKEEEKYIQTFEADHSFGDREVLIEKVWNKTALDKKYREVFKVWHDTLSKEMDKTDKLAKVVSEYINVIRDDPGLPKELLGEKWIGFEAHNIFKEIKGILLN